MFDNTPAPVVILHIAQRPISYPKFTAHPTAEWICGQIAEVIPAE
jgi:hypothetical protein